MNFIPKAIKRNTIIINLYDKLLQFQNRTVDSYIFVANSGRSGSASLVKIFEAVDKAISLHEPYPIMFNNYPDDKTQNQYFKELFYSLKRIYIKRYARYHKYYLETNHQFIKNFASYAIEYFGPKIKVIHLIRDPVSVATSFYSIDSIPGETKRGKSHLIDPRSSSNIIQISDYLYNDKEFEHNIYKCLWYWYEVESRTKRIIGRYPKTVYYDLYTDDLNNINKLEDMFRYLKIKYDRKKLSNLVGTKENIRQYEKKRILLNKDQVIEMNQKLLSIMEDRYGHNFWLIQ